MLFAGTLAAQTPVPEWQAGVDKVKSLIKTNPEQASDAAGELLKGKNKKNVELVTSVARAYLDVGQLKEAETYLEMARKADNKAPAVSVLEGDIAFARKDIGKACQLYEQAIYFDSNYKDAYLKYAQAYKSASPSQAIEKLNQLKAMTTTLYINERPAYGRNKVRLPHVASFCATGNNLQFLTDDTGNRRWLPFEVEHIENPWTTPIDYEGVYTQAKALLDGGFRYWFQGDEVEALNRRNRRFEAPNPARELILAHYRRPSALEKGRYLTASQICARFASMRLSPVQVGRAMKELGFEQKRLRSGYIWIVADRSAEEMNSVLPESLSSGDETIPTPQTPD